MARRTASTAASLSAVDAGCAAPRPARGVASSGPGAGGVLPRPAAGLAPLPVAPGRWCRAESAVAVGMSRGRQDVFSRNLEFCGDPSRHVGPRRFAERDLVGPDQHGAGGPVVDDDRAGEQMVANLVALGRRRRDVDPRRSHPQAGALRNLMCGQARRDARQHTAEPGCRSDCPGENNCSHEWLLNDRSCGSNDAITDFARRRGRRVAAQVPLRQS